MSLVCVESRELIRYGTPLYIGLRTGGQYGCALAGAVVDAIPESVRLPEPCASPEDGVDIHAAASGGPTFRGAYEWSSLVRGKFLFSVSREDAVKLLPMLWEETKPGGGSMPMLPLVHMVLTVIPPRR